MYPHMQRLRRQTAAAVAWAAVALVLIVLLAGHGIV